MHTALYFTAVYFSNFGGTGILHTLPKNSLTLPPPGPLSMWVMSTDCHVRGNQILKYLFPNSFKRAITNLLHINIVILLEKPVYFPKQKNFLRRMAVFYNVTKLCLTRLKTAGLPQWFLHPVLFDMVS